MERILAISDIHGQGEAMECLLQFANYSQGKDRLFFLGDYISKGSGIWETLQTLQYIKKYVSNGAVALRGNHEQRVIEQCKKGAFIYKKYLPFLTSLPYYYEDASFLFVHAGIRPRIPLQKQNPNDLMTIRDSFLQASFTYEKTIVFGHTPTDRLGVSAGDFWIYENKIGIDTGAGQEQFLSLADLTNRVQYRVSVSVKEAFTPEKIVF